MEREPPFIVYICGKGETSGKPVDVAVTEDGKLRVKLS